ncbi:Protein CBG12288 [Caenorhabditis briggsae]|uniref:Protein CBG12288 n=2 Tax=Caenorhabditis briggsae TaxID=6238 RepID=A8XF67_CAEBR|nr:Protein CBG12288 [Caenorhabditis briggsae]ULU02922.1 hypothetical protein L3Y34_002479 [Caenorhabditis briggsae]CAP31289.1 Protein CBG12288 [Caenorhabditis briggsae]
MSTHFFLFSLMILSVSCFRESHVRGFASDDDLSIEHLKEHYGNKIDIEKHTSSSDRKFYYFKVGDQNLDHFLDGIELMKLITEHSGETEKLNVEDLEVQVDQVIGDLDRNGDGMISFGEYSRKFD